MYNKQIIGKNLYIPIRKELVYMDANVMKRMIVLKNLQSNMIEEAYVVFKNNVKVHKYEMADSGKNKSESKKIRNKDYMVKEAEMIINDYISNVNDKDYKFKKEILNEDYNRLKIITISLALFSILNFALFIFK